MARQSVKHLGAAVHTSFQMYLKPVIRLALWCGGLNHHMWCLHLIWVLVNVSVALVPIQVLANVFSKAVEQRGSLLLMCEQG